MASHERYRLPQELESDQQAAVLYSPFREKSLNPQSWTRKAKFWENLLAERALERRIVTFDVNVLPIMFERKGMQPKCLGTVVEEMKKSGRIRSVESYTRKCGWLSWSYNTLIKQPFKWGVGQLFGPRDKESSVYVWPEVVKKLCEDVVQLHHENVEKELSDNLVSVADLRSQCLSMIPSDQDFNIVLTQLERDNKITVVETQDMQTVIKFCRIGESSVTSIQEIDLQIYRIQLTVKTLEKDIQVLISRAQGQIDEARRHVREGNKYLAKHCLRNKKAILRMMDKRSESLTFLQDILQKIEAASTNEMVLKACQDGADLMKNINQKITAEGAESIMDNVREALDSQEEISQVLSSCMSDDDQEQLELDLQQLIDESTDADQKQLKVSSEKLEEDLSSLFKQVLHEGQTGLGSNSQQILTSPDDLGLPDVPTDLPSHTSHQGTTSSQALPSHTSHQGTTSYKALPS